MSTDPTGNADTYLPHPCFDWCMSPNAAYTVEPSPVQRSRQSSPDEWVVKKGGRVVERFDNKKPAVKRGRELAKKNNAQFAAFNATNKFTTDEQDYRTEDEIARSSRIDMGRL